MAQTPDERAKVFMDSNRRLKAIIGTAPSSADKVDKKEKEKERELGALPKVSREKFLYEAETANRAHGMIEVAVRQTSSLSEI